MLWAIRFPAGSQRSPHFAEQFLAAVRPLLVTEPISLLIGRCAGHSGLFLRATAADAGVVLQQLLAAYPDCRAEPLRSRGPTAAAKSTTAATITATAIAAATVQREFRLNPSVLPLRAHTDFEDSLRQELADPLAAILAALGAERDDRSSSWIEITAVAARDRQVRRAQRFVEKVAVQRRLPDGLLRAVLQAAGGTGPAAAIVRAFATFCLRRRRKMQPSSPPLAGPYADALAKLRQPLFAVQIEHRQTGLPAERIVPTALRVQAVLSNLCGSPLARWTIHRGRRRPTMWLSAAELATLWHPPTESVQNPGLDRLLYRQLEPPKPLPGIQSHPGIAILGRVAFHGRREAFGLLPDDRRRHLHIVGKTGMGKSTLLLKMLSDDIAAGRGAGLIDPHGDLVEAVLARVPRARTNDVALFDAGERAHPVAFNPLACDRVEQRPLVADGVLAAFKRLFGESWGPRMEDIFRNAVLALTETPGATLLSVLQLLTDARFRRDVAGRLTDPVVRTFWEQTFASWNDRYRIEAIAPVENKVRHFTSNPILRGILGQPRSSLDLRQIMDRGQVLLVNLSKGRIGDDASKLLGSLLTAHLQLAAMGRAELPEAERRDFFVCIDEFQSFLSANDPTVATILSESRKFRLSLTLAHQFLEQLDEATRAAVFGNVGSLVAFQVGATDAEMLAAQFGGDLLPSDLMNVPRYTAYARLLLDGQPTRPFSLTTLPPSGNADPARADTIRRVSRRRYSPPTTAAPANRQRSLASIG